MLYIAVPVIVSAAISGGFHLYLERAYGEEYAADMSPVCLFAGFMAGLVVFLWGMG